MYTFYGFVVSLIVFVVFTIQSDAVGDNTEKAPNDGANLPYEVVGKILHKAGLKATKGAGQSRALIAGSRDGMSRIFEDRMLVINVLSTCNSSVETSEYLMGGRIIFDFGNYANLMSLFETYGKHARSIFINYHLMDITIRRDINKNIINKYANHFTELRIHVHHDIGIWDEMSNENGQIQFSNVKRFTYACTVAGNRGTSFDLNAIFPKLESVKLSGSIKDPKCLANVANLKELSLSFSSIPELQYQDIFSKNKQISKLSISPQTKVTLQFIERYLTNLQTLKIFSVGDEFLNGGDRVYNLPSVTSFFLKIHAANQLTGSLSFKMPNLKRLTLRGEYIDQPLYNFINQFENLDTVEIKPSKCDLTTYDAAIECIENLRNVKEYISPFYCDLLPTLRNFFETFDETKSKLSTLKLICIGNKKCGNAEEIMNEINAHLKESKKPTWTLADVVDHGTNMNYLIIKRNP